MPDIVHLIRIKAAPARVYEALTTADGIAGWWTRDVTLDGAVGGIGAFQFYGCTSMTRVRIDTLEPERRVAWTVLNSDAPGGWDDTTIAFTLRRDGEETVLSLAHRGFASESEGFALVSTGWAYYLVSLQHLLERGAGKPQQEKDFAILAG
ncbi:MAG TPA: SRPBCC domain-containing protein [Candidatus Cybelea sp.]|nr:SRPBCC domain-containing protein [Candidatus Cybelea sp.]